MTTFELKKPLIVPDTKDNKVVCQGPCDHYDCTVLRARWIGGKCHVCGQSFEPGQEYHNKGITPVHAKCWEGK